MKNRFTEEQIIKVLKEHEGGRPATDIVRELGIAEQTFLQLEAQIRRYERFRSQKAEATGSRKRKAQRACCRSFAG